MPTSSTLNCSRSWRPSSPSRLRIENPTTGVNHMRLVIIGAGFARMYAALSAARLRAIRGGPPGEIEVPLVAPEPALVIRPRLYEQKPEILSAPLLDVLNA